MEGRQRTDRVTGAALFVTQLIKLDDEGAEIIPVTTPGSPDVGQGAEVRPGQPDRDPLAAGPALRGRVQGRRHRARHDRTRADVEGLELVTAAPAEALWQGLNATQADGTECVMCERSFTCPSCPRPTGPPRSPAPRSGPAGIPAVPVGRSRDRLAGLRLRRHLRRPRLARLIADPPAPGVGAGFPAAPPPPSSVLRLARSGLLSPRSDRHGPSASSSARSRPFLRAARTDGFEIITAPTTHPAARVAGLAVPAPRRDHGRSSPSSLARRCSTPGCLGVAASALIAVTSPSPGGGARPAQFVSPTSNRR